MVVDGDDISHASHGSIEVSAVLSPCPTDTYFRDKKSENDDAYPWDEEIFAYKAKELKVVSHADSL